MKYTFPASFITQSIRLFQPKRNTEVSFNSRSAKLLEESSYTNFSANRFSECLSKQSKKKIDEVSKYARIKVINSFKNQGKFH